MVTLIEGRKVHENNLRGTPSNGGRGRSRKLPGVEGIRKKFEGTQAVIYKSTN